MQGETKEAIIPEITPATLQMNPKVKKGCKPPSIPKLTMKLRERRTLPSVPKKSNLRTKKGRRNFYTVSYDHKFNRQSPHHELTLPRSLLTNDVNSVKFYSVASIWALKTREHAGRLITADPVDVLLESVGRTFGHLIRTEGSDSTTQSDECIDCYDYEQRPRVYCACADSLGVAENAMRVLYSAAGGSITRDSAIYIIDQMDQCYFAFHSTKELNQILLELHILGADAFASVVNTIQPCEIFNGSRRYHTTPSTFLDPTGHGNALWDESDWA